MPTSKKKPKSFTFTLSKQEYEMLQKMAKDNDRSMANFLRRLIKESYEALEMVKRLRKRGGP